MWLSKLLLLAVCSAPLSSQTSPKQTTQQHNVTCLQTKSILAVTDYSPQQFSYQGRGQQTYVYGKLENEQVTSLTSMFYITTKDCTVKKSNTKNSN